MNKKAAKHSAKESLESAIHALKEELKKEDKTLHHGLDYIKKHLDKLWEHVAESNDRLQDLEVQSNLLTRLLTTVCVERLKLNSKELTKLIRRIEKEAIEDSQIMHLEHLYSLEHEEEKKIKHKARHPRTGEEHHGPEKPPISPPPPEDTPEI